MALRVLLITPEFYGIEKLIKSILEESGYEVYWFENKSLPLDYHGTNSKFKFLRRIYFFLFFPQVRYIKKELRKIRNIKFDILFSINANIICPFLITSLKNQNPEINSILFLWDSFSMYNWSKEIQFFNNVYTFDLADSIKYHINYKPNFYIGNRNSDHQEIEYDLFFAGKFSSDRLEMIDKLVNHPDLSGIKCIVRLWPAYKIFFHNHLLYVCLKRFRFKSNWACNYIMNFEATEGVLIREYLVTEKLTYDEVQNLLRRSNVSLDLPYQGQTGYTHRLIAALSNGKKVITTNAGILKENYYNSEQVTVIDRQNLKIDADWIKKKISFPVNSYISDLELTKWLKSIINVGIA